RFSSSTCSSESPPCSRKPKNSSISGPCIKARVRSSFRIRGTPARHAFWPAWGFARLARPARASAVPRASEMPSTASIATRCWSMPPKSSRPPICRYRPISVTVSGLNPKPARKPSVWPIATVSWGGSIEDASGNADAPIYAFDHAVARVRAAPEAAQGLPFLLTARAENFLNGRPDLDDTLRRLQAYSEAGAHVLYAPGLPDLEAIRTVCSALDKPVNVVMGMRGPVYSVEELAAAGVRRISVGGSLARAALGALVRSAQEVRDTGTIN